MFSDMRYLILIIVIKGAAQLKAASRRLATTLTETPTVTGI
jgi:hypothetical protein